jgi:hypothetical protein
MRRKQALCLRGTLDGVARPREGEEERVPCVSTSWPFDATHASRSSR